MKIGIIAHLKHPIRKPYMGGLEAFTYDICSRLKKRGHDITLFASELSDPALNVHAIMSDADYDHETLGRFRSHELCQDFISTHHAYLELMQDIDRHQFDVIFNNSLNYVPITMASLIKTPMVTVLHTPPIFELKRAVMMERQLGLIHYVTVSAANAKVWIPFVKDCEVITNGIDLTQWKFQPDKKEDYVAWFGRIHPDKGTHLAIEAARLAGKKIKIAGSIADQSYFDTYVEPLLNENVEWLKQCTHDQLNTLVGNAEVSLITPCWNEPFGLVVAESLACGTPVAGIASGALPSILCPKTGALTKTQDPKALAKCIKKASLLKRYDCRQRAENYLDVEQMVATYERLFRKVAPLSSLPYAM